MSDTLEEVLAAYGEALGEEADGALPPVASELGIALTDYEPKKHLYATAPAAGRWAELNHKLSRDWLVLVGGTLAQVLATLLAKKPAFQLASEGMHFRSAQADGRDITVEARVKATRGSIMFLEVTFKDPDSKLVGRATYQFAVLKSKKRKGEGEEDE